MILDGHLLPHSLECIGNTFTSARISSAESEPCHVKTDLKIFVVVILKEDLAGTFWYDTDYSHSMHRGGFVVSVIPKERIG